jgi:predicted nucleic acid-binding protein
LFDEVRIGEVVYKECITRGKEDGKSDAFILEGLIEENTKFRIKKILSRKDFEKEKMYFIGSGETDVYLMANVNETAVVVTSDNSAYKKLLRRNVKVVRTDELVLLAYKRKIFNFDELCDNLSKLKLVGGTTEERIVFLIKKALSD